MTPTFANSPVRQALCSLLAAAAVAFSPAALAQQAEPPAAPPASDPPSAPMAATQPVGAPAAATQPAAPVAAIPNYSNVRNEWSPGDPVPPGYHPETQIRTGLVIAGSVTLGASWLTLGLLPGAIVVSACTDLDASECTVAGGVLMIPVLGPFLTMPVIASYTDIDGAAIALLTVDGLIQSSGLAMLIAGIVAERDVLVRDTNIGGVDVKISPLLSADAIGTRVGITGSF